MRNAPEHSLHCDTGIYAIFNTVTRRLYVGCAASISRRRRDHMSSLRRGEHQNPLVLRDLRKTGVGAFAFFILEQIESHGLSKLHQARVLRFAEKRWASWLGADNERTGYNLDCGGQRTRSAQFRDQETKLARQRSRRYVPLPGTDFYGPINEHLLASWVPGR